MMRAIAPSAPPSAPPGARAAPPRRPGAARRAPAAAAARKRQSTPAPAGEPQSAPPPPSAEELAAKDEASRQAYLEKLRDRARTGAMYRKIRPKYDMSADIQLELQEVFLGVNTVEEVETEEDELTKQLASFSAYQRSLGLVAAEDKSAAPAKTGIWETFNPWDFNALPSVETSLAELKAGGILSEAQCERFRNRRYTRYQKDYILTRGEIVAMAKALYDNGHFHSFDRDYEMRKFIHHFKCMYRSLYDIKRIIDKRIDVREAQINEILLKQPQKVPCPIELAVADAALVVEFELDLQLHMMVLNMREGVKTSEAFDALVEKQDKAWLSATVQALKDGLDMPQLAALGLRRHHLEAAASQVKLPFSLQAYDAFLAEHLKPPDKWELLDSWLEGVQPATPRQSAFRDRNELPEPDKFTFIDGYKGAVEYDEDEWYRRKAYPTDGGTWAEPPEAEGDKDFQTGFKGGKK